MSCSESNCRIPVHVVAAAALQCNDERAEEKRTLNRKSLTRSPGPICNAKFSRIGEKWRTAGTDQQGDARKKRHFWMPSRAWRSGLEPAELSFRVPHFFHQTRKGPRGAMVLNNAHFTGIQKLITDSTSTDSKSKGATGFSDQVLDGRAFNPTSDWFTPRAESVRKSAGPPND